jgi:hypothetical protein
VTLSPHLGPLEELPGREPADHEVAAGALAGLVAGGITALLAMALARQGSSFPLRLVAATFLGHEALDEGSVGPVLLGGFLGALGAVVLALFFASMLPRGRSVSGAVGSGLAFGLGAWVVTWFVVVRMVDPVLFAAGTARWALALDLVYGAILGLLLPPLRRILP